MIYSDEIFLAENKYTKQIPVYLREYPKFIRLLKMFSNYIQLVNTNLETILSKLNIQDATGDLLEKIAQRLDIYIEKPLDANGAVQQKLYEEQLRIAILGNGLKKKSKATRASVRQITDIFNSILRCKITDFNSMNIQLDVVGVSDVWSPSMLEKYVFPNITGVNTVVTYILNNDVYFGFDKEDAIKILGTISVATASITQAALNARAVELGYSTNKLGYTITDSNGNNWVFINLNIGWQNKGTSVIEGESIVDASVGYGIRGWDKGKWAQTKVIK